MASRYFAAFARIKPQRLVAAGFRTGRHGAA